MARLLPLYSASSQAEIERLARLFFEEEGRPAGRELDHWLLAEAEFLEVMNSRQWQTAAVNRQNC